MISSRKKGDSFSFLKRACYTFLALLRREKVQRLGRWFLAGEFQNHGSK